MQTQGSSLLKSAEYLITAVDGEVEDIKWKFSIECLLKFKQQTLK